MVLVGLGPDDVASRAVSFQCKAGAIASASTVGVFVFIVACRFAATFEAAFYCINTFGKATRVVDRPQRRRRWWVGRRVGVGVGVGVRIGVIVCSGVCLGGAGRLV